MELYEVHQTVMVLIYVGILSTSDFVNMTIRIFIPYYVDYPKVVLSSMNHVTKPGKD